MRCDRAIAAFALPALLAGCMAEPAGLAPQTGAASRDAASRTVIVVLHGEDQPDIAAGSAFAKAAASAVPDSMAVALSRPDGSETATPQAISQLADRLAAMRRRHPEAKFVLVGGRASAVLAADLAGLRPALVDGMVLVSCPCALPEWRRFMARSGSRGWNRANELDPLKTAGGIQPGLKAAIVVGANDPVTPVRFSRPYAEALALRGVDTEYRILLGHGPATLADPEVLDATRRIASALAEGH